MFQPEFSLPLSTPLRFFRAAPCWLLLASLVALGLPPEAWQARFSPAMLALTHLLMLGFAGNIMLGALLQVCAVLTGVRAHPTSAIVLWLALQTGTGLLAWGLWHMQMIVLQLAALILLAALLGLTLWLLASLLLRSALQQHSPLLWPILGLLLLALSGGLLVSLLSTGQPALALNDLLRAHIVLGSTAWLSGLIIVVGFTVIPMFLVAPAWPRWLVQILPGLIFALAFASAIDARALYLLGLPVVLWYAGLLRVLHQSQRRADPTRALWAWGGINLLLPLMCVPWLEHGSAHWPAATPVLLAAYWLLAGVLPIITAMLAKIIPFLLWMDYRLEQPSGGRLRHMGQLFPERWLRRLSYGVFLMGIVLWPLSSTSFKAIPLMLMIYALALAYCLERSIRIRRQAS
ncbi:hypothetical protein ABHF33_16145 [Chitinibacter sp. FCG-7]|uniref:Permease n=1 Tax=Chitinibacter mangrovi TaxID=3153927 RepID=A0AAU7F8R5_9NEIS